MPLWSRLSQHVEVGGPQARVSWWSWGVTPVGERVSALEPVPMPSSPLSPQIYLSWKSGPGEVKHWKDMIARPRQPVAQWHQLKA